MIEIPKDECIRRQKWHGKPLVELAPDYIRWKECKRVYRDSIVLIQADTALGMAYFTYDEDASAVGDICGLVCSRNRYDIFYTCFRDYDLNGTIGKLTKRGKKVVMVEHIA